MPTTTTETTTTTSRPEWSALSEEERNQILEEVLSSYLKSLRRNA
jgi:uncharacterized protein (UPF0297 family)